MRLRAPIDWIGAAIVVGATPSASNAADVDLMNSRRLFLGALGNRFMRPTLSVWGSL